MKSTISTVNATLTPYLKQKDKVSVKSISGILFNRNLYFTVKLTFLDTNKQIVHSHLDVKEYAKLVH